MSASSDREPALSEAESGFVLLIVLVWLALLMFVATQMAAMSRSAVSVSANIVGAAVAQGEADGAVNAAIFQVLAKGWKPDGSTHLVRGPQAAAEVRIEDEGARVDPNVAPPVLMQALLQQCGAAAKSATELAAAVAEWRSLDLLQSANSADQSRYPAAGRRYLPPHSRFVSVDELGLVAGMTSGLLDCLAPHLTVYALSVPSPQTTHDPVILAALAEAYSYDPAQDGGGTVPDIAVIRVTATAWEPKGSRFRRVAVVRVAPAEPDESFLYRILAWEEAAD
jgi:general secretion pathway protein K